MPLLSHMVGLGQLSRGGKAEKEIDVGSQDETPRSGQEYLVWQ